MIDEHWDAIIQNNSAYDDIFLYAVKSTGIFCRPSCKSRIPKKENVRIYTEANDAIEDGYRPCKRCKPTGLRLPDEEWIEQITGYIDQHFHERVTLALLADIGHGSPFHLQKTFKKVLGISPLEYLQQVRIAKAKKLLTTTNKSLSKIGDEIGMSNIPYFITLFKRVTGYTPIQFRKKGNCSYE